MESFPPQAQKKENAEKRRGELIFYIMVIMGVPAIGQKVYRYFRNLQCLHMGFSGQSHEEQDYLEVKVQTRELLCEFPAYVV